jgi:hypothetical protein
MFGAEGMKMVKEMTKGQRNNDKGKGKEYDGKEKRR